MLAINGQVSLSFREFPEMNAMTTFRIDNPSPL